MKKTPEADEVQVPIALPVDVVGDFSESGLEAFRTTLQKVASCLASEAELEKRSREEDKISARDVRVGFRSLLNRMEKVSGRPLALAGLGGALLGVSLTVLADMVLSSTQPIIAVLFAVLAAAFGGFMIAPAILRNYD